ncbi:reverse transcriptase family protein [Stenotrophomonas maltophilia]|uniref:reverse transcriptase family protein n=1 Tax=Stenotrophomonas maltophilia TaxID=40324 RepID=UPI0013104955|nr:reverse transcriptase family protein [Stenotrophomonas maltophilia]MCU1136054.1 RNA-directed DNA polymerase [Stenotrophomonas maltophilia]
MTLPRKSANRYDITSSAFFRLPTLKALARVLQWDGTPSALRALCKRPDNFSEFYQTHRRTGKKRLIQAPNAVVKPLQKRLNVLLKQICVPDYLHSGIPKRSHLTNSECHMLAEGATVTVDVSDFYPSITRQRVFKLFRNVFQCPGDIADAMADLVCYNGKLATGSPASVLLSFWACRDMFDLIAKRVADQGGTFSLYVDDVAITGNTIGHGDVRWLDRVLRRFGFASKVEKAKVFRKASAKMVTGRAFRDGISRAPNRKHKEMHESRALVKGTSASTKVKRGLVGQLENIGNLDQQRGKALKAEAQKLRSTLPPVRRRRRSAALPTAISAAEKA